MQQSDRTFRRLVRIASFLTPAEADVARMHLAADGIPACVSGAAIVTWFWHYSAAVGGVSLDVLDVDERESREILENRESPSLPSTKCPHCHETIEADWRVCWACGHDRDGQPVREATPDQAHVPVMHSTAALGLVTLFSALMFLASGGAWLFPTLVLLFLICTIYEHFGPSRVLQQEDDSSKETTEVPPPTRSEELTEQLVGKIVRSAVLGFVWFQPLCLFSLYLAIRVHQAKLPLSRSQRRRVKLAINIAGFAVFAVCGLSVGAVLLGIGNFFAFIGGLMFQATDYF